MNLKYFQKNPMYFLKIIGIYNIKSYLFNDKSILYFSRNSYQHLFYCTLPCFLCIKNLYIMHVRLYTYPHIHWMSPYIQYMISIIRFIIILILFLETIGPICITPCIIELFTDIECTLQTIIDTYCKL